MTLELLTILLGIALIVLGIAVNRETKARKRLEQRVDELEKAKS